MTATRKTRPAGAGEAAACQAGATAARSALIVPLPGALLEPVAQLRRRGRNPKDVAPLWRKRMEREPELQVLRLAAQIEHAAAMRAECFERCNVADDKLRALEKACKEAHALYVALSDEYGRRDAEVKRLEADRSALLRALGTGWQS